MAKSDKIKLNIGCGNDKRDGFINIDIQKELNPDLVLDIRYLESIADCSVDYILASHVLEHFQHWLTGKIFSTWVSKLKVGGKIEIWVPDMAKICKVINENSSPEIINKNIKHIYGAQDHSFNYHCTGFTMNSLIYLFKQHKLTITDLNREDLSIIVKGEKTCRT